MIPHWPASQRFYTASLYPCQPGKGQFPRDAEAARCSEHHEPAFSRNTPCVPTKNSKGPRDAATANANDPWPPHGRCADAHAGDDETKQQAAGGGGHVEEIRGRDLLEMIRQEG